VAEEAHLSFAAAAVVVASPVSAVAAVIAVAAVERIDEFGSYTAAVL